MSSLVFINQDQLSSGYTDGVKFWDAPIHIHHSYNSFILINQNTIEDNKFEDNT